VRTRRPAPLCYDRGNLRAWTVLSFVGAATVLSGTASAGTFWVRERAGGVVEFTNKTPSGGRWKVWLKTGPGKAAALRGSTDLVPAHDTSAARFSRYDQHIRDQLSIYGIPEALVRAVIKTESDYDPSVVSSAGAQGLMQLMPDTARLMGVSDAFDPRQNIMGGCRYLQVLARRFCKTASAAGTICTPDEKVKIVAAYHAGPGAVEKYGGIPPYETTHAYVAAVMRRYAELGRAVGGGGGDVP
jgi:soluble lytic murein transglycosylase-like protein